MKGLWGALLFYTVLPLPPYPYLDFRGIAVWSPIVGMLLAIILGLWDGCLEVVLPFSSALRGGLVVVLWLVLTGGLHLDGAMDTADGMAVTDPQRRLAVMADSRAGAFAVMAAIVILGLKTFALTEIASHRFSVLLHALAWGRWGHLFAITHYPYLKEEGKGKLHQEGNNRLFVYLIAGLLLSLIFFAWDLRFIIPLSCLIALLVGFVINSKLGGQTGDTYGAIVEWTEALTLVVAALLL
ncbi:MAG: adenosylcobinamide-GDP ribazoletransferase [Pseudanabaenaceae cyanobacterium SKYGB_i_bin29]|nr:adenosylcobinamide-GDP ribazoletransferase [Pseudanabaenaceae cyanobacterium SKYG29]MDW8420791.1 adenosylcobinamide-GDP ribazoletransferase [Pseudanabaenaceae cyanobacterium SKYGB_i_bin29]